MSADGRLGPGTVLGDRFEIHGVIGRGGTATVVLATDRLRSETVALKVVHPHLAADPSARRRLQREVRTASVLRSPAALVPNDLHELDGLLALSMPFHPGQPLAERVTAGPMPPEEVRALGVRIAGALADAHRAGLLHRDVTANNVLVGDHPDEAVLTDFGLARLQSATRSTGLLGTAGYAAPEVYAGDRADPRSDLYGLGALLYLAVTGRPAFDPSQPVAAFKQQIEGAFRPVRDLSPGCPPDLAATIERLLSPDPGDRPQGAPEVVDALVRRRAPEPIAPVQESARPLPTGAAQLPTGSHAVLVRERSEDGQRRRRRRRERAGLAPTPEDELARWGRHLASRVRDALGVPAPAGRSPEEALAEAVGREGALPEGALTVSPALDEKSFWLVEGTDAATARRLASTARTLGFKANSYELVDGDDGHRRWWAVYTVAMVLGWVSIGFLTSRLGPAAMALMVLFTILPPILLSQPGRQRTRRSLSGHPVAYAADLRSALAPGILVPEARRGEPAAPRSTRGGSLEARAARAIDALEAAVGEADLPEVARHDLRRTAAELRRSAVGLAAQIDRLDAELAESPVDDSELAALQARLDRLTTLAAAGVRSESTERDRLLRAIDAARAGQDAADAIEGQIAATTARLIEITGTAARVRRELLLEPEPARTADQMVERLQAESRAASEARRETQQDLARRARASSRAGWE